MPTKICPRCGGPQEVDAKDFFEEHKRVTATARGATRVKCPGSFNKAPK